MKKLLLIACLFTMVMVIHLNVYGTTCAGATVLNPASLPIVNQAMVCGATNDLNSTNVPGTLCVSGANVGYKNGNESLYRLTPTISGNYTISIVAQTWSSIIVYNGCPNGGGTCVGGVGTAGTTKNITVNLTAGVTYYIWFDTWPTPNSPCPGTFSITAPVAPPANDLVCNATVIACGQTLAGTTVNATNSGTGENQTCGTIQTQPGVWYVVAGTGQIMTASLCGTGWDSKISVFSGPNCSSLTCIGGIDDNGPSCAGAPASFSWTSVIGTNYYILVHGFNSTSAFNLALTCITPAVCNYSVPYSGSNSITTCSGTICDHGGIGNYTTFANGYTVINPTTPGYLVSVDGTIDTEFGYDYVEFYDGIGLGTFIIGYWGTGPLPAPVTSTTGPLTIRFVSDLSINYSGFSLNITCLNPLPIELVSFDATCDMQSGNRTISWQTASETNNEHFVIERSSNAIDWTEVHRESGAGNSNTQLSYEWIDQEILSSTVYYRLTQVDFNGQFETFNPTTVTCNPDVPVAQIRPNPNDGNFQLWFTEPQEGTEALIEIVDNMGRVLSQQTVTGTGTAIAVQFNVTLNAGVYHLRIGGSVPQTVNFIVIK